jgi:hypothetical protein
MLGMTRCASAFLPTRRNLKAPLGIACIRIGALTLMLSGCDKIGPTREHNAENKVNSPSDPHYIPPPGSSPRIDQRTGEPERHDSQ